MPDISDLDAPLGFWLRLVSNHVSQAFAASLAAPGVTVAESVILRRLHGREPMPPSRLADEIGVTRGAITKLADRLIAKALVVRAADRKDGRAQTLALTDTGRALVPDLAALAERNDAQMFGRLTQEERETLLALLKRLAEQGRMSALPIN